MAEKEFAVAYVGNAVDTGRMDVRDLAPALLALADVYREANAILNPDAPKVSLEIKAQQERGSFLIDLIIAQLVEQVTNQTVSFLANQSLAAVERLYHFVGTTAGIFSFIMYCRERRIERREVSAPGTVRITFSDGTVLEFPAEVLDLYDSPVIRRRANDAVVPVQREGIERFEVREGQDVRLIITKDDLPAFQFAAAPGPTDTTVQRLELVLRVVSQTFVREGSWRFDAPGLGRIWAKIEDEAFLDRVANRQQPILSGDLLRVVARLEQSLVDGEPKTEWAIEQVTQVIPGPQQSSFPNFQLDD